MAYSVVEPFRALARQRRRCPGWHRSRYILAALVAGMGRRFGRTRSHSRRVAAAGYPARRLARTFGLARG